MSKTNMFLFSEQYINTELLYKQFGEFGAIDQKSQWAAERNSGWIWINIINDNSYIWENITREYRQILSPQIMKTQISILPSREIHSNCFALDFCRFLYKGLFGHGNIYLFHEYSGLFSNDDILYLKPKSPHVFYDSRNTDRDILLQLSENLQIQLSDYIDSIDQDLADNPDDGMEYISLFDYLYKMRDEIFKYQSLADEYVKKSVKEADKLILETLYKDKNKRLLKAYRRSNAHVPLEKWWWHLDQVDSGEMKINLNLNYLECKGICIYF